MLLSNQLPAPERAVPMKSPRLPPNPKTLLPRTSSPTFLYVRSSVAPIIASLAPDQVPYAYLLRCPACYRTKFTSLQGLLNHGRISHQLEWGTHDECVRACAVTDPHMDVRNGVEVGIGPGGILPGLRSLFEMAVGTGSNKGIQESPNTGLPTFTGNDTYHPKVESRESQFNESKSSGYLNRSLGLHEDTPMLAPFLGRGPAKRHIRVWNEEEEVDIDKRDDNFWHFRPRRVVSNDRITDDHESLASETLVKDLSTLGPITPLRPTKDAIQGIKVPETNLSSRFHFTTRIIIACRSLWVPIGNVSNLFLDTTTQQTASKNIERMISKIRPTNGWSLLIHLHM